MATKKLTEICRSFSYKHNLGNYQSADFFCSAKREVTEEEMEEISEFMYQWCKEQVVRDLNDFKRHGLGQEGDSEYGTLPKETGVNGATNPPIKFKAKETDSWRGDNSAKYKDVDGEKVLIDKDENTLEPQ